MALGANSGVHVRTATPWGGPGGVPAFPTTGMRQLAFSSEGFKLLKPRRTSGNIAGGIGAPFLTNDGTSVEWSLSGEALYNTLDHLIYGVMGYKTTVTEIAPDGGAFSTVYAPAATLPILAFQVSKGDVPTGMVYQYPYNKVNRLEIVIPSHGPVTFTASGMGFDEMSTQGTGSAPAAAPLLVDAGSNTPLMSREPVRSAHANIVGGGSWDIGTGSPGDYCVTEARIVVDRKLPTDDYCVGSDFPAEPNPNDYIDVSGEMTIKFGDRNAYDDFKNQTTMVGFFKFVSPTLIVSGGTIKRTLEIYLNSIVYDSPGGLPEVDTPGILTARIPFTGFGNEATPDAIAEVTDPPIAFRTRNNVNTVIGGF